MLALVNDALSIIKSHDWTWRMEDSNYKSNQARAKRVRDKFTSILKKFSTVRLREINAKNTLRDLWVAHYELSIPFRSADYYDLIQEKIKRLEETLEQIIELEKEKTTI